MSILKKLFGGGKAKAAKAVGHAYNGYEIFAEPMKEPSGFRIAARIEKEIDGEVKSHTMIRADILNSYDEAVDATIAKAQSVIDQQGDRIF